MSEEIEPIERVSVKIAKEGQPVKEAVATVAATASSNFYNHVEGLDRDATEKLLISLKEDHARIKQLFLDAEAAELVREMDVLTEPVVSDEVYFNDDGDDYYILPGRPLLDRSSLLGLRVGASSKELAIQLQTIEAQMLLCKEHIDAILQNEKETKALEEILEKERRRKFLDSLSTTTDVTATGGSTTTTPTTGSSTISGYGYVTTPVLSHPYQVVFTLSTKHNGGAKYSLYFSSMESVTSYLHDKYPLTKGIIETDVIMLLCSDSFFTMTATVVKCKV